MATETAKLLEVYADERGRILVGDSLTYVTEPARNDVVVCGSFAGSATVSIPLRQGVRGVIAHEAGVGKDGAGIGGLKLADRHGVPAAAVETMSARIADGDSLYRGKISQVNNVAAALGVQAGMLTADAAKLMLDAPVGSSAEIEGAVDEELHEMHASELGKIIAVWSILLVEGQQPNNVYCVASHSGETMAKFAKRVMPKGIIANDAGKALDGSGIGGLAQLDEVGVAAAAVGSLSARIGDGVSTFEDGVISAVNSKAKQAGVVVGIPARKAALLLLNSEN